LGTEFTSGFLTKLWSVSYALFAALSAACALKLWKSRISSASPQQTRAVADTAAPKTADYWMWLLLPALGSTMLLATTNQLCMDVAAIPLLWLLPMGLYLLSFILCFHSERWYSRCGFGIALGVALAQACCHE
jgi:hypothetical protein